MARENGTTTLFDYAWDKVNDGMTTVDEVIAKIHYKSFAKATKKRKGALISLHRESKQVSPQA